MKAKDIKQIVKEKYGEIARQPKQPDESSCCSCGCSSVDYSIFSEDYSKLDGYDPDADMGLGCGVPTQFAGIKKGDHVLDLGSGAGNDCFVVRAIVGETGMVTGIDFTEEMLVRAEENNKKLGFTNVRFVKGDIEEMPLPDNSFDVVVSNCVLNLVPDKSKAFGQIMRVLRPTGHFCVSDVVIKGNLPEKLRENAEMYAGCVSGAIDMDEYLKLINIEGFKNVTVHKQKEIAIPAEVLSEILSAAEIDNFRTDNRGIFSITVSGYKG